MDRASWQHHRQGGKSVELAGDIDTLLLTRRARSRSATEGTQFVALGGFVDQDRGGSPGWRRWRPDARGKSILELAGSRRPSTARRRPGRRSSSSRRQTRMSGVNLPTGCGSARRARHRRQVCRRPGRHHPEATRDRRPMPPAARRRWRSPRTTGIVGVVKLETSQAGHPASGSARLRQMGLRVVMVRRQR